MELSRDEVLMILKIVREADIGYLDLQVGDLRLTLSKEAPNGVPAASGPTQTATGDVQTERAAAPAAAQATVVPAAAQPPTPPPPAAKPDDGMVAVPAPMVGIFYSRPEPGAAPFVQVGDTVGSESTVGLIEVMKVFNAVKARAAGRVERLLVEDGQFVEFGQALMLVKPLD